MIRVYQTKFGGPDAAPGDRGDCYKACLASILELRLIDVPDFQQDIGSWCELRDEFLRRRGLSIVTLSGGDSVFRGGDVGPYILVGPSPRGDYLHAVVGHSGRIVHDPAERKFRGGTILRGPRDEWEVELLVRWDKAPV